MGKISFFKSGTLELASSETFIVPQVSELTSNVFELHAFPEFTDYVELPQFQRIVDYSSSEKNEYENFINNFSIYSSNIPEKIGNGFLNIFKSIYSESITYTKNNPHLDGDETVFIKEFGIAFLDTAYEVYKASITLDGIENYNTTAFPENRKEVSEVKLRVHTHPLYKFKPSKGDLGLSKNQIQAIVSLEKITFFANQKINGIYDINTGNLLSLSP